MHRLILLLCSASAHGARLGTSTPRGSVRAPGWKNRPAAFPGRMLEKTTTPGFVLYLSWNFFWVCLCCSLGHFDYVALCCVHLCFVSWLFCLGCQYRCKWLAGKTRFRNDIVDGDVKLCSLTHSLTSTPRVHSVLAAFAASMLAS